MDMMHALLILLHSFVVVIINPCIRCGQCRSKMAAADAAALGPFEK